MASWDLLSPDGNRSKDALPGPGRAARVPVSPERSADLTFEGVAARGIRHLSTAWRLGRKLRASVRYFPGRSFTERRFETANTALQSRTISLGMSAAGALTSIVADRRHLGLSTYPADTQWVRPIGHATGTL
jgi:hypothetical protein